ncbi:MAG: efflux RND transporter periplasmic adaptor subunit [Deltaproteobacteria bacterium]|nr:MAG: efflux RND transporter periplasmic adaptor subunit [Deltaproteobacteria bacterium]
MLTTISGSKRFSLYVFIILASSFIAFGCGKEEEPPEVIRSIKWTKVAEISTKQIRMISGTTKPVDQTALSFAVAGTVEEVNVKLGEEVKKGQVLAELDRQPFVLGVRDAEAGLSRAQARVVERRANYERYLALYESNNASKAELDEARASFDSAKSQVKAAEAQLGLARRDLRKTKLMAPFNGTISVKEIEPFVEVPVGRAVFGLDGEESGYEVSAAVPDSLLINLSLGDEAEVVFPTLNDRRVRGVITELGSRSRSASTYPVTVQLQEQFDDFRSGMSVEVAFEFMPESETGEPIVTGLAIPLAAIFVEAAKTQFVFVYDEKSSTVKKTQIKTLNLRENDVLVEPGALKAGDIIATAGVQFLVDGQKVNLMEETK